MTSGKGTEMNNENAIAVAEKTCGQCGHTRPIEQFRYRDRGKDLRHTSCNQCFARYQRENRAGKRGQDLKHYVTDLATDVTDPQHFGAVTRTEAVLTAMLTRFGGLERFANDWFEFLRLAIAAGKHHVAQRSIEAILRLIELTDRGKEGQEKSADDKTDEELHDYIVHMFVREIWNQPQIAVVVLEELGWKLKPPDELPPETTLETVRENVEQRLPGLFSSVTGAS